MNIILNRAIRHSHGLKHCAILPKEGKGINLGTLNIQVKEPLRY